MFQPLCGVPITPAAIAQPSSLFSLWTVTPFHHPADSATLPTPFLHLASNSQLGQEVSPNLQAEGTGRQLSGIVNQ